MVALWCSAFSFICQSGPAFVTVLEKMPFCQILCGFFDSMKEFDWPPLYFILLLNVFSSLPDSQFFSGYDGTICVVSSIFFWVEKVISELSQCSDAVVSAAAAADIEKALGILEDSILRALLKHSSYEHGILVYVSRRLVLILEGVVNDSILMQSLNAYRQSRDKRNSDCIYQILVPLLRILSQCIYLEPSLCPDVGILLKCRIGPEAVCYAHRCILNAFSSNAFCYDETVGDKLKFDYSSRGCAVADVSSVLCASSRDIALCEGALGNLRGVLSSTTARTKRKKGNCSETLVDHSVLHSLEQAALSIGMLIIYFMSHSY